MTRCVLGDVSQGRIVRGRNPRRASPICALVTRERTCEFEQTTHVELHVGRLAGYRVLSAAGSDAAVQKSCIACPGSQTPAPASGREKKVMALSRRRVQVTPDRRGGSGIPEPRKLAQSFQSAEGVFQKKYHHGQVPGQTSHHSGPPDEGR